MKLLLTSTGIKNKSIEKKFFEMVGKGPQELAVAYIPTAMHVARPADKHWIINNLVSLHEMKIRTIDIVDISAISEEIWRPRLEKADAIMVGGGNPYHLIYWMRKTGLSNILPNLLKDKVYIGCSAGSVVLGKFIISTAPKKYLPEIPEFEGDEGLGIVDFCIRPHFYNPDRPQFTEQTVQELANQYKSTFYALDDNSVIAMDGDNLEVISEGKWGKFEQKNKDKEFNVK